MAGNVDDGATDAVGSGSTGGEVFVAVAVVVAVGEVVAVDVATTVDTDDVLLEADVDEASGEVETSVGPAFTPGFSPHATTPSPTLTAIEATTACTRRLECDVFEDDA